MSKLTILCGFFASFSISFFAIAVAENQTPFPTGAYKIRAAQVDYYADGTYKIYDANTFFVQGEYQIEGDIITMTDTGGKYGCKGDTNPAQYHWSTDGASITYKLIEDRCDARRMAMLESPFAKLGEIGFKLQ